MIALSLGRGKSGRGGVVAAELVAAVGAVGEPDGGGVGVGLVSGEEGVVEVVVLEELLVDSA